MLDKVSPSFHWSYDPVTQSTSLTPGFVLDLPTSTPGLYTRGPKSGFSTVCVSALLCLPQVSQVFSLLSSCDSYQMSMHA